MHAAEVSTSSRALVIGAGPAGMSAALWLTELKVPFEWVEASGSIGGQLRTVYNPIENYLGAERPSGQALIETFAEQLELHGLKPTFGTRVQLLRVREGSVEVTSNTFGVQDYGAVIVATGTERRFLGVPGEQENRGRGVALSGRKDAALFSGMPVAVVGGGDAAVENALLLAEHASHVTLLHRGSAFRARTEFLEAAKKHERIQIITPATLLEVVAGEAGLLSSVVYLDGRGEMHVLPVRGLLVRVGVQGAGPPVMASGTLVSDNYYAERGDHERIFFAGDCICPDFRAVAVAGGQGAEAARKVCRVLGLG